MKRHTGWHAWLKKYIDLMAAHCCFNIGGGTIEERIAPGISQCWKVFNNGEQSSRRSNWRPTQAINCRPGTRLRIPIHQWSAETEQGEKSDSREIFTPFLLSDHQRGSAGRNWEGEGCASSGGLSCWGWIIMRSFDQYPFSVKWHPWVIWKCTD